MGTVLATKNADRSTFQGRGTDSIKKGGDEAENVNVVGLAVGN
jgi:hypothetical protein